MGAALQSTFLQREMRECGQGVKVRKGGYAWGPVGCRERQISIGDCSSSFRGDLLRVPNKRGPMVGLATNITQYVLKCFLDGWEDGRMNE